MDYSKPCSSSSGVSVTPNNQEKKKVVKQSTKGVKLSTDPQSIAARERRHRISDRFKTLQSLVPGGTKMDTVSMLEEAIHYVKFLKTQVWLHQTMMNFNADNFDDEEEDPSSFFPCPLDSSHDHLFTQQAVCLSASLPTTVDTPSTLPAPYNIFPHHGSDNCY
ncbi:hypothetical protein IFM89_012267 [Coptis chinensis]|uniref:BHLH domain-containing protein n=1 Tax=Coptis chinensis TaxID=261450 RepID=A0A835HAX4_9MAGN|nr:hypothetical protein IFM89_012267 [Coptis chinensis]